MAGDRKLLSGDMLALKEKIRAEMLRRSYSGSVAAYGGTAYDFEEAPADGKAVRGEHLKKNVEPMQAVNPDGLPEYPGELTRQGQENMEVKITAWATRDIQDHAASDCKSGCTGTCYTSCQTGCYTGCTSCTGCGSGCADGCSGGCTGSCTGCGKGCKDDCDGSCSGGCDGDCKGCSGCGGGCSDDCSATCGDFST